MDNAGLRIAAVVATVIFALAVAWLVGIIIRRFALRIAVLARLPRARTPFRVLTATVAANFAMHAFGPARGWHVAIHLVTLLIIASAAWFVTALLFVLEDSAMPRVRTDMPDNRRARAVRTQMIIVRRVTAVVVAVFALATALMTFQEARLVGTSLLASAGVAAAIAAFATNTLLGNVISGLQIAFSGSLRLDDVVVVQQQWGRVEEITLTYIVVRLWDDRRLILPTSYFTNQPFENWTHAGSELLGTVVLDVDWQIGLDDLRAHLRKVVEASPLWDERVCVVQVVDAVGGYVTIRALISAANGSQLWDLRCLVREELVAWVRDNGGLPVARAEVRGTDEEAPRSGSDVSGPAPSGPAIPRARNASAAFSGPAVDSGPAAYPGPAAFPGSAGR